MSALRAALYEGRTTLENPSLPLTSPALIEWMGGTKTYSGQAVTERSAVRFIAVYRAVSLVSGVIAAMPLRVRAGTDLVDVPLATDPHPDMTSFEFWERVLWAELLTGNAYCAKIKLTRGRRSGELVGLDPYPVGSVTPHRVKRSTRNPWGKEFELTTSDSAEHKMLLPDDVFHIPGPGYDTAVGLSPIGVARQSIGIGLAGQEYAARHFGSGSMISGVLQTDVAVDQTVAEQIRSRFKAKTTGPNAINDVAVLDRGLKFVPIGMNPKDAAFLESVDATVVEIARLYGLPPHLLADVERSTSWGTGIEQQNLALIAFTLGPWMTRAEKRFAKECLAPGLEADFDASSLLRGDVKTRMAAHREAITSGFKMPSEARADEGLKPVKGLDRFYMPVNYRPTDVPAGLADQVNAAAAMVKVGFEPDAALKAVGLDPVKHSGYLPNNLTKPGAAAPAPAPVGA